MKLSLVDHLLQANQGRSLMAADIAEVIRTGTSKGDGLGVLVILYVYLVKCRIVIVTHTEHNGTEKFIVFHQFNKTNRVDLFSSANHFVTSVGIDVFE
jgi:hypothetical protein